MNDKVTTLITKWETLVNEQQQRLDNIKDFVSEKFIENIAWAIVINIFALLFGYIATFFI